MHCVKKYFFCFKHVLFFFDALFFVIVRNNNFLNDHIFFQLKSTYCSYLKPVLSEKLFHFVFLLNLLWFYCFPVNSKGTSQTVDSYGILQIDIVGFSFFFWLLNNF